MRLALTVVTPAAGQRADVILDADPATLVAEVAAELAGLTAGVSGPGANGYGQVLAFPGPRPATAGLAAAPASPAGSLGSAAQAGPAGPGSPAGLGAPTAPPRPRPPAAPPVFVNGLLVPPDLPLAASPLRSGSVVSLGDPSGCLPPEPAGPVELRVVGGPAAGRVHRLSLGSADVGSGALAAVRILDPAVPAHALTVTVDARGQVTVAAPAGAGVLLERAPLAGAAPWCPGQQLAVGFSLLELAVYEPPDAALAPDADGGGLDFNRPPRLLPPDAPDPVPAAGAAHQGRAPAAADPDGHRAGGHGRRHDAAPARGLHAGHVRDEPGADGRQPHRRRQAGPASSFAQRTAEFREHKARIEQDAAAALSAERAAAEAAAPDPRRGADDRDRPAAPAVGAARHRPRLPAAPARHRRPAVRRRAAGPDAGRAPPARSCWSIPDAPVTVPLRERGVLGVAGPGRRRRGRSAAGWSPRSAVLHSPNDVQLCVLTDSSGQASWEWARWLPHAQPPGQRPRRADRQRRGVGRRRIAELLAAIIAERQKACGESPAPAGRGSGQTSWSCWTARAGCARCPACMPGAARRARRSASTRSAWTPTSGCCPRSARPWPSPSAGGLRVQQMSAADADRGAAGRGVGPAWCARLARGDRPDPRRQRRRETAPGCRSRAGCSTCSASSRRTPAAIAARWRAGRPVHAGDRRRVLRRPVRHRPAPRRPARADRRHHRLRASPSCCRRSWPRSRSPTGRTR